MTEKHHRLAIATIAVAALLIGSCERERSNPLDPEAGEGRDRPATPVGLTAEPGVGFIRLSWQPVTSPDLAGYAVYRASKSDGDYQFVGGEGVGTLEYTTGKTSFVDSLDADGATHFYRLAAVDTTGLVSQLSAFVGATALADRLPPEPPPGLSAVPDEEELGRVLLRWSHPRRDEDGGELSGLDGYAVLRAEEGSGSPVPIDTVGADVSQYTDTGIKRLTTYSYTIVAFDSRGNSSRAADEVLVTTRGLAVPGRVTAAGEIGRVVVSWDAVSGSELLGYNVYRSDRSDTGYALLSGSEGGTFTTGRTTYEDAAVEAGRVYFYRVEAVGSGGLTSEQSTFVSAEPKADEVPPASPSNVSVVADEADFGRVVVTWGVPLADTGGGELTGLSGYAVFRSAETTDSFVRVADVTEPRYEDTGLSESTTYFYAVVAIDGSGNESGRSSSVRVKTRGPDLTSPESPSNVSVVADETDFGRALVTWSASVRDSDGGELTGLSGYAVFRSVETTDSFVRVADVTEPRYEDTGLSESTTYFYAVVAIDGSGNESGRSSSVRVKTRGPDLTSPESPSNVSVSTDDTDPSRITVRWNASVRDSDSGELTGLSGYVIFRSEGGGGFSAVDTVSSDVREYEDAGLDPLTDYRCTVSAFDEAGNSSSQATSVLARTGGLAVPGRVTAAGEIGRVVVSWDAVSGSELQGYNVYRSDRSDTGYALLSGSEGGTFTTGRTTYEDAAVEAGRVYFYRVEAVGSGGLTSEQSTFVSAEPKADEVAPQTPGELLIFSDDTEASITLSWSGSSQDADGGELTGLQSYVVFRGRDAPSALSAVDTVDASQRQYIDTGLETATTYYYAVSVVDESGNASPLSAAVSATTPGVSVPSGVTAGSGIKKIEVSWNSSADDGLLGYNVYRSTRSDQGYTRLSGSEGTSFTTGQTTYIDSGLTGGSVFFYRVSAVTQDGESERSAFSGATVSADIRSPAAPTFLDGEAVIGDPAAIALEWKAPTTDVGSAELTGLVNYLVYRGDDASGPFTQVGSSTTTSYLDDGLEAQTTYFHEVEALDEDGNASPRSSTVSLTTTGVQVPQNVSLVSTTPSDAGEDPVVTIAWGASAGAILRYEVQRTTVANSENDADYVEVLPHGVATTRDDSGVTRGNTYYYRVRTVDSQFRESEWTTPLGITVSE